jgi:hypothetical protein
MRLAISPEWIGRFDAGKVCTDISHALQICLNLQKGKVKWECLENIVKNL